MSNRLIKALAKRWLGIVATIAVIVLGVALIATSLIAARTETALRQQIAKLVSESHRTNAAWGAKLAACEAGGSHDHGRVTAATLSNEDRARELARNAPAGFDLCARMESADRAVLETLK